MFSMKYKMKYKRSFNQIITSFYKCTSYKYTFVYVCFQILSLHANSLQFLHFMEKVQEVKQQEVFEHKTIEPQKNTLPSELEKIQSIELQNGNGTKNQQAPSQIENKDKSIKNTLIESQMKKIGFLLDNKKKIDKNQFANSVSNIIGEFLNPLIFKISEKEKSICLSLGWKIEAQEAKLISIQTKLDEAQSFSRENLKQKISSEYQICNESQVKTQKRPEGQTKKKYKDLKRRIIRKKISHPSQQPGPIKRTHQQKVLVKQMEEDYDCKLRNNRLYMKGMPKKPVSSFFFFFKDYSKKIHEQNQHLQVSKQLTYGSALAKRISKRWKQMTNQEKIPYKKMSLMTREDYRKRMDAFKQQNSQVFESFKKIKRMKANQTRRIKLQKNNLSQSQEEIQQEDNSQSLKQEHEDKKTNGERYHQIEAIDLQNDDLPIVLPHLDTIQSRRNRSAATRQRLSRERFKSIHKPKSPSPSFFFFYNEKKAQIAKQYGVNTGAQITKHASVLWKVLPDKEKKPYEQLADDRRKKYYEQMKRFQTDYPEEWANMQAYRKRRPPIHQQSIKQRQKQQNEDQANSESQNEENSQSARQQKQQSDEIDSLQGTIIKKQSLPQKTNKQRVISLEKKSSINNSSIKNQRVSQEIKRQSRKIVEIKTKQQNDQGYKAHRPKAPVSSFFMFYKQNNAILADQFKQAHGGKLVQYASEIWKNMTESQKRPYQMQAEESRQKYYKQMEEYKQRYPNQIKQRRMDLKKKHQQQAAEIEKQPVKKRKRRTKNQMISLKNASQAGSNSERQESNKRQSQNSLLKQNQCEIIV